MASIAPMGAWNTLKLTAMAPCGNEANQTFVSGSC